MGYNNGYDSGYSDALEDVRNGKVAGFGSAGGGAGAMPSYMTNTDTLRYAEFGDNSRRAAYSAPSSVTASYGDGALDFQVPQGGVPAGTVMNLSISYQILNVGETEEWVTGDLATLEIDGTITVNGSAVSGLGQPYSWAYGYRSLVLWFDGESWVCVAHEDDTP